MLTGRNIVITGCNRGIGRAILKACVSSNASIIWACVRNTSPELDELCDAINAKQEQMIKKIDIDFLNESSIRDASLKILADKVKIDGIVNNAGINGENRLFTMTSMKQIRDVFQVNFFGPMMFLQTLLRIMVKNRSGSIVNISSVSALDGNPGQLEYVASKAAILGATKKLAIEYGNFGIRVNAVAPGITETDMISNMEDDVKQTTLDRSVFRRAAKPVEIADVVTFLLSDRSNFITGETIRIDGGRI